ncbi:MAG: hypothetical protein R2941_02180 [Desulfobacterales bacterium]
MVPSPVCVFMLSEEEKADADNFDRVQMMAEDYIRMGMARVQKIKLPEPYKLENFSEPDSGHRRRCERHFRSH